MLLSWILSSQARKDAIFIRSMVSRWWGDIGSDAEKGCAGGKIYGKAHKSKHTSCAEKSCYYWMQNDPIHLNVKCKIWLLNGWFSCIFLNICTKLNIWTWMWKGLFMHGNIQWKVYIQHKPRGGTPLKYLIWWQRNFFLWNQKSFSWLKKSSVALKKMCHLTSLGKHSSRREKNVKMFFADSDLLGAGKLDKLNKI